MKIRKILLFAQEEKNIWNHQNVKNVKYNTIIKFLLKKRTMRKGFSFARVVNDKN